jgi:uncharacterized protein YjgD (DUF1641 family)
MAEPIPFALPPRDPREALFHRLENAPDEHAEALLAAYDVLQGLHDRGVLELAKGVLRSGDKVLEILVDAGNTPEVIHGIRNFIIMTKLFGSLEPKLLEHLAEAVPNALVEAKTEEPLGLLRLMSKMSNKDARRILTIMIRVLESLGKDLGSEKSQNG